MKYSPVPGSGKPARSIRACLKSPVVFYVVLIGLSFGAGYLTRSFAEYWRLYSRLRSAGGHDLTVKRINMKPISNGEQSRAAPAASANEKPKPAIPKSNKPKVPCDKCSAGLCDEPDPTLFTEVSTEIQLYLSLRFPCSGVVTQWKLIDYSPTPGKVVYIDVIRYINATDQGTWMGYNEITTTGEAGWVTYDVPKANQLKIESDWLIATHYDDLNADGVIPHASQPGPGLTLYDGFGLLMDHQELKRLAPPLGVPSPVPMTPALKQLLVELHHSWRAPALAAVVTPST